MRYAGFSSDPSRLFPRATFGKAASEKLIADAEKAIGRKPPGHLRSLYAECDGFREDRGNAKYVLSLFDEDGIGSLVSLTRYYRAEWKEVRPTLDFSGVLFFGLSLGGEVWGITTKRKERIIAYHHHMEDELEVVGSRILGV